MLKVLQIKTECCSQDVSNPDSYSGRPGSKSRFRDQPSCFHAFPQCVQTIIEKLHIAPSFHQQSNATDSETQVQVLLPSLTFTG